MQIGELARAVGVNIQTIRFYEREKLLPPPPRTASGYRDYSQRDLDRVLFIKRNHQIGFTLTEVRQLLDLHAALEDMPRPLRRKPKQVKIIIAEKKSLNHTAIHIASPSKPIPTSSNLRGVVENGSITSLYCWFLL